MYEQILICCLGNKSYSTSGLMAVQYYTIIKVRADGCDILYHFVASYTAMVP